MTYLALPESAKRVRALQARIENSRKLIAGMPAPLRLSAHRTHRNAMRVALGRVIESLNHDANQMPAISAQRIRLEDVACELDRVRIDDLALEAQARQIRGVPKLAALETATAKMLERIGNWAEVLENPLAAMRRRRVQEA